VAKGECEDSSPPSDEEHRSVAPVHELSHFFGSTCLYELEPGGWILVWGCNVEPSAKAQAGLQVIAAYRLTILKSVIHAMDARLEQSHMELL
jgi:hypothetical protein